MKTYSRPPQRHTRRRDDPQPDQGGNPRRDARSTVPGDVVDENPPDRASGQLRTVLDGAAIGIAVLDSSGRIVDSNLALQDMLGYDAEEISALMFRSLIPAGDVESAPDLYERLIGAEGGHYDVEIHLARKDGQLIWCHATAAMAQVTGHAGSEIVVTLEDTTERRWMSEALGEKEKQLRAVIDQARDGIFIGTPRGLVVMYSRAMKTISGYTMMEANESGWFNLALQDPIQRANVAEMAVRAISGDSGTIEVPIVRKDGEAAWIFMSMSPISVGGQKFALGVVTDITDSKRHEERLTYLATHDGLTGLPNRVALEEVVGRELAWTRIHGPRSVLLVADLDNFKLVNDTLGHSAGDQVLIALTQLLRSELRSEDVLARLGGDELGILLFQTSLASARSVAERLRQTVDEFRFTLGSHLFHLGLSIGVAPIEGQSDVAVVLSQADAAMYEAKALGRNRVQVCQSQVDEAASPVRSEGWAAGLKNAVVQDNFVVYYQPVVNLSDGSTESYEARPYLRLSGDDLIRPEAFSADVERLGLMPRLTRRLFERVVEEMQLRPEAKMSIGLSPQCLASDDLLSFIEAWVRERVPAPARLGFELAETTVARAFTIAQRWMERLKALGCYLVLGDFGSGFSSFSDMRNLPVDLLKVDGTIIRRLSDDPGHRVVVQAIHSLASLMGKQLAAKSVDNQAVSECLREIGVTYGVGDYLGPARQGIHQTA